MGGKKVFLLVNQHNIAAWLGCEGRVLCWSQRRWTSVSTGPTESLQGVHGTQAYKWVPTSNFVPGTFIAHTAFRIPRSSAHPQSYGKDNTQSPCHSHQGLSLHRDAVLMGQDTAKPMPDPERILAALDPGKGGKRDGCMSSQEEKPGLLQPLSRMRQVKEAFPLFITWVS
ncbi:hypothetical protein BTVI_76731 [Pitangus sulphuratus]|nr:hypothetical protein BTVI_76731 [Pitangus sulphuratus]